MKKQLFLSLTVALATQALSPSVFAQSAMTAAIEQGASVENQQIASLQNDLKGANENLLALESELKTAKASAPQAYKNGVFIRNASILAAAGGLAVIGLAAAKIKQLDPQWADYLIAGFGGGIVTAAGAIGTATGETMIKLNDQQVAIVESQIHTARLEIRALQHKLEEIK